MAEKKDSQKQEYMMQLSMLDKQAKELQQQIGQVNQQIKQYDDLKGSLDDVGKVKEGEEMLAPIGRGIFFKSEIKDKKLLVNVGENIILKKTPEGAKKIVDKQVKELEKIKKELEGNVQELNKQVESLIVAAQKS